MSEQIIKIVVGGIFAPPLPVEKARGYRELAASLEDFIKEPFLRLCDMVEQFHETPESQLPGIAHVTNRALVVPLEDVEKDRMYDAIPWPHEMEMYGALFELLDPVSQKTERDAAFHLLWFARELDLDREPLTTDKLH